MLSENELSSEAERKAKSTLEFSALNVIGWRRKGTDYNDPKWRNVLIYAGVVFCGIIIGLLLCEAAWKGSMTYARLPGWLVLPPLLVAHCLYCYAYYRVVIRKKNVELSFESMRYIFDFDEMQLLHKTEDGTSTLPLFVPNGIYEIKSKNRVIIIRGAPTKEFILGLESRLTPYKYPAHVYDKFFIALKIDQPEDAKLFQFSLRRKQATST